MLLAGFLTSLLVSTVIVCLLFACFQHCVLVPRWLRGRKKALNAIETWHDIADVVPNLKVARVELGGAASVAGDWREGCP